MMKKILEKIRDTRAYNYFCATTKNILLSNMRVEAKDEKYRKIIAMNATFISMIVVFLVFAVINIMQESFLMSFIETVLIFPALLGLFLLRKNYNIQIMATFATLLLFLSLLLVVILREGIEYTLIWTLVFAFVAMILKGARVGLYFSIVFYATIFYISYGFINQTIIMPEYIRFVAVSIIFVVMSFFYEQTTQNIFNLLKKSIGEVEYLNQNLEKNVQGKIEELNISNALLTKQTKNQEILLSLFDTGDTVLFNWNNDDVWSIRSVSSNVINLLGYEQEDFESSEVVYSSCIHKDDLSRVTQELVSASESGVEFFKHEPYRVLNRDGRIRWILDYTTIVRDESNNIISYIGILADITEIKEKDKQLLQQSRLAQMGELISMIAHQWRQPLGAISSTTIDLKLKLGFEAYELKDKQEVEKFINYFDNSLNNINDLVQNLTLTIDDFRNFYKPNKVAVKIKFEDSVSKAINIIKGSFISHKIEVDYHYHSNVELSMYKNEMMQVILNLLKNAQDNFAEKEIENPKIIIITDGNTLTIYDNGGGIPSDIIGRVFDPYFSTKSEKNGTGLGLYMSKVIVEEHHQGRLEAINIDDGVCFKIQLKA